jgi:hypothetical protein
MTSTAPSLSEAAEDFTWLLRRFAEDTDGVHEVIAVSSDGLLVCSSGTATRSSSDRLAAIVSGIASLAGGAGASYGLGPLNKVIIDTQGGYLLVMAMSAGALLGVIADRGVSMGSVAYETALFIARSNGILSPQLVDELKNTVEE